MGEAPHASTQLRTRLPRAWLFGPLVLGFVLIACGYWLSQQTPEEHTVSHVKRAIRDTAREGASGKPGTGVLGRLRISAQSVDQASGDLIDFRMESGRMVLAAERASIAVDPAADTFTIEARGVVYTHLPEGNGAEAFVHHMDTYTLGPAHWGVDIVPDGTAQTTGGRVHPAQVPKAVNASDMVRALEAIEQP